MGTAQLVFEMLIVPEFILRVFGSYMTLDLALALRAPFELVGEAQLRVNEDDIGSEICIPLGCKGHICGYVNLTVNVESNSKDQSIPGFLEATTFSASWMQEDT